MLNNPALRYALWMLGQELLTIDDEGRIWRHAFKTHGQWRFFTPPRRAENIGGKGYLRLTLSVDGVLRSVQAQRVIWEWCIGPIYGDLQVNHKDLNRQHNHLDNLELTDGAGNVQHAYAHGRTKPWSLPTTTPRTWRANRLKLTEEQIAKARHMREQKYLLKDIAAYLGIGISHAQRITTHVSQ